MIVEFIIILFGGALAGFSAGLLGIGGGLVVVPVLNYVLPGMGFPDESVMHVAVATSLMIVVGTSISSIYAHNKRGAVMWPFFRRILPGLIVGALLAAQIAGYLPSSVLRIVFGVFVLFLAYGMVFNFQKEDNKPYELPKKWKLFTHSALLAALCNFLGMGGGSLLVPYFSHYRMPMRNAVATAAVCSFPIALTGVIGLMLVGETHSGLPAWTTGYIYWPAFILMVIPSILCAPFGAHYAHKMPAQNLRRVFAVFLLVVGLDMLSKAADKVIHWF